MRIIFKIIAWTVYFEDELFFALNIRVACSENAPEIEENEMFPVNNIVQHINGFRNWKINEMQQIISYYKHS